MKFPKRSTTHKIEAASWRLLQELAPDEWIVREVSERDYGVDAYIEIGSSSGDVTGNLVSIQLKGVESLTWQKTKSTIKETRSPQIKVSTANYWLNLPVPVFLFVADLSAKKIHYISVEESIRRDFAKLSTQESITFKLLEELDIKSKVGGALFNWFVMKERAHEHFVFNITNLLSHIGPFADFIAMNQNRDSFMEVELDAHLQLRALYMACRSASIYLENEWKLDSLREIYVRDVKRWKEDFVLLHEESMDYILSRLEPVFVSLVRKALKLVAEEQADYWRARDPIFHRLCSSGELEWSIKHMEKRLGRS